MTVPPEPATPTAGLHAIALFEGAKGALAVAAAAGLELLGPQPLRQMARELAARLRIDVQQGASQGLLDAISDRSVHWAAAILALYAAMRFVEAWGLWRTRAWASWLGCIGSALYLPLDVYALLRHPGWHTWALLIVNVVIVAVLARDIRRRRN
ncbi:DUF2127 domain-containing protein [Pseudoxanthomonas mexicana]|uniref:DUF2127 domain-containing protein n=1 Tax=Pseudoxanthomonas mexicana TaxID=128785 RepID=UPI00398AE195